MLMELLKVKWVPSMGKLNFKYPFFVAERRWCFALPELEIVCLCNVHAHASVHIACCRSFAHSYIEPFLRAPFDEFL